MLQKLEALYEALTHVRGSGRSELTPTVSFGAGVVYPELLKVVVKYGVRDVDLLEDLEKLGVLEKLYYDSIIACPSCGSTRLFSKLRCPYCGSENLKKIAAVAHTTCGGITMVDEGAESPRCSKCGKPLAESTVIGRLYQCLNCGARFETPLPAYKCADCGRAFDYREARYLAIYKYKVRRENLDSVAKKLLIEIAREVGEAEGFKVEVAAQARGRSGFYHTVDLAFSDRGKTIYMDVIADSPRAMSEALASLAKMPDLQSEHTVLVPKNIEKGLQGLSEGRVVAYGDAHDLSEQVKRQLRSKERGERRG